MTANISGDDRQNEKDFKTTSVLKAAWLIAVVTIVSKLIGFVRDIIIANYYGASLVSDAYYYAYQIPSLSLILLGGVGGPFHSATVAIFSKLIPCLKDKPSEEVNKLYSTFMTATTIFFLLLSIIMFVFPHQIMSLIISIGSADMINLAAADPYKHLRPHETKANVVCRLLLEKKNKASYTHPLAHETSKNILCRFNL